MLTELKVSQFAIIDKIHIHFDQGLNILSGETGAGKSILIKSLALLMGAKSSAQDIRSNKDRATIEGAFELKDRPDILEKLEEMGVESEEHQLIVRRLILKNGKSRVYLNGHLSTVTDLRRVVFPLVTLGNPTDAPLVEITGQHENKDLMSRRYQMDILDQFCGNLEIRADILSLYNHMNDLQERMNDLRSKSQHREQQIDFLEFQIKEIESLELIENEDEELKDQIKILKEQGQWQDWIQKSLDTISDSEPSVLGKIKKLMQQAPNHSDIKTVVEQMQVAYSSLEDVAYQLQNLQDRAGDPEYSLEEMEERLSRIRKLQKKFGQSVGDILRSLGEMKTEFSKLNNASETLLHWQSQYDEMKKQLIIQAEKLRKKRMVGAQLLGKEVNRELKDLNMKGLQFIIAVSPTEEVQSTGMDRVLFQTQTGSEDEPRELARAASGGELSRILLSLKQVVGANQFPRTFLFDEVDTGVSGPTAEKVGSKLKNLAKHQQVICVTHLPQVASFGDHHFFIEKQPTKKTVEMSVKALSPQERVNEIARLISGEKITQTSRAHAKELLSQTL